jgi:ribonuclease BN (tRNA processing enzyme)
MQISVIGAQAAWPTPDEPCSCFLITHRGYRLILDIGTGSFATLSRLIRPEHVDAVVISHGHPDHVADLHPLLRARALGGLNPPQLPVYAFPEAVSAVLALDEPGLIDEFYSLVSVDTGDELQIGPFSVTVETLPHFVPNVGFRLECENEIVVYTGDAGPSHRLHSFARDATWLIAEATFPEHVPGRYQGFLSDAASVAKVAAEAHVRGLLLTHRWPGENPADFVNVARRHFGGRVEVAMSGMTLDFGQ